jgi:hypothetical protein
MTDERDPTNPLGLGAKGGMGDDAADAVFGPGTQQEDGQAVGAADHQADRARTGADGDRDSGGDTGPRSPYELLTGDDEPPQADDGESVGASDREADVRRSR